MTTTVVSSRRAWLLVAGVAVGALGAMATLAQPLVIGELVRVVGDGRSVVRPLAWGGLLFCADAGLAGLQAYLLGRAGSDIVFDLRRSLTNRLLRADLAVFDRLDHGDVFTRVVADTSVARMALAESVAQMATSGFVVAGSLLLMAWIDPLLLLVALGCIGGASLVSVGLAVRIRRASVVNREDTSRFGSALQRAVGSMTVVRACRAEDREAEAIGREADRARRSGIRVSALSALLTPAMNVGTQLSLAAVIGLGMSRVATNDMEAADLTAFVVFLFYLVSPLVMLFVAIGRFQHGRAAIQRINELRTIPQEATRPATPIPLDGGAAVAFDRVSFAYPGRDRRVLEDVSFVVPRRGVTAIVGPSGAGKSTIFKLVERFYRPETGSIALLGRDLASLSVDQIRQVVGYVEQEASLMRGTLRDNLTYANPDASDADIADALALANLTDVVARLPQGLATDLGERGIGLSGGQKQRLAVARALLQRPSVILLDEATAHLDGNAEAAMTRTMAAISRQCAVVAIGHRLPVVAQADLVIVLDGGRVRATGSHESLLASDPLYRQLAAHDLVVASV